MPPLLRPSFRGAAHLLEPLHRKPYSTSLSSTIKLSSLPAPHSGTITVLSLNRPQSRNALSRQLLSELTSVITSLSNPTSTRALILTSESDEAFCAGADLKERLAMTPTEVSTFLTNLRATFTALSQLPIPTISALSSRAFGGGLELALCTHFRVFTSSTVVGLPETRLAIIPGAGGTFRLPALIGQSRARDLILTGRSVAGPEAYFLGLCDRLVEVSPEEDKTEGASRKKVLDVAVGLAKEICEGGPIAIKAAMEAVDRCALGQEAEAAAYEKILPTEDRMEALRAFGEKRKPVYKGR